MKDYTTVSKNAIRIFIDFLHHINVDTEALDLTELLEVLYFLHYEGKTKTSEFEKRLADYLYDELLRRKLSDEQSVMVAHYLSKLDNPIERYENKAVALLRAGSIKDILVTFEVDSKPYLPIVKRGFNDCSLLVIE